MPTITTDRSVSKTYLYIQSYPEYPQAFVYLRLSQHKPQIQGGGKLVISVLLHIRGDRVDGAIALRNLLEDSPPLLSAIPALDCHNHPNESTVQPSSNTVTRHPSPFQPSNFLVTPPTTTHGTTTPRHLFSVKAIVAFVYIPAIVFSTLL